METTALTFAAPLWFAALALVPVIAVLLVWSQLRADRLIGKVVAPRLRSQLAGGASRPLRVFRAVLFLAALAALAVALARPQMGYVEREIKQQGRDIILAIDTSRSMLATDVAPTRLARAKLFAQDLLQLAAGDRIGIIAFAGSAFLQAPLTLDRSAALAAIDELDTSIIPKGGTNIAEAIRMAEKAFGKGEGQSRALIIVTDGEELDADGINAARQAQAGGVRIFTVGVGSTEGSLIPLRDGGKSDFVRDQTGKPVQSRLDASRLQEIAEAGGGFYEPLGPEAASAVFTRGILPIDQVESGSMASRQPIERYQWPLGVSMACLVLWMLIGERRFGAGRRKLSRIAAMAALFVPALAPAQDGVTAYEGGDYESAFKDFEQRLQRAPDSAKLLFNAGAAAYKLGDYGQAVDLFSRSLAAEAATPSLPGQSAYNLANALVRRGEAAQGKEEKRADWKSAIDHYEEVLRQDPANKQATENIEIVKKLLEELDKEDQQNQDQQKQDQQNQDQQNQDQQKQDQQKQDQQKQDQQKQDQQSQDQQSQDQQKQDQQKQDQQKQDQQNQDQQNQDQQNQDQQNQDQQNQDQPKSSPGTQGQQHQQPRPTPTPGEKKEGEIKAAQPEETGKEEQVPAGEPEEKEGEMSAGQARALLNSLRGEEDRVPLMRPTSQEETLRDW